MSGATRPLGPPSLSPAPPPESTLVNGTNHRGPAPDHQSTTDQWWLEQWSGRVGSGLDRVRSGSGIRSGLYVVACDRATWQP
nr:hypothetical protein [Tanacetum cinerariifolium]